MGKPRIIAETGAGQHGVASATVAAHLGLECVVYMGTEDMARQALNVARMRMLGTQVVGVESGSRTLKDAINEAMRDWVTNVRSTHYLLGSVLGAHPYPPMVRDFQAVIGGKRASKSLVWKSDCHASLCLVGGGSNSIGLFYNFLRDPDVKMIGIEAGGRGGEPVNTRLGLRASGFFRSPARRLARNLHLRLPERRRPDRHDAFDLRRTRLSRDRPEHAWLADQRRAEYSSCFR